MDKANLNELYTEEGFDVLDFNTFSLLEKHGVLSGENSCSKFTSHLLDFIEELDKKGIQFGEFLVHSNENCPNHQEYINKGITDLSTDEWDLPAWASWELTIHIGVFEDNDAVNGEAIMNDGSLEVHLGLKTPKEICKIGRQKYYAIIQHEMKHYFDNAMAFNKKKKKNDVKTCQEIHKLFDKIDDMQKMDRLQYNKTGDNSESDTWLVYFFTYLFYRTSEDELSAWLEDTRYDGYVNRGRIYKRRKITDYSDYKKLLESILLWKEDKSQYDKICHLCSSLGNIKTYDEFKKFMMETFGSYLESRFGKKESFEKYIKRYIKILDKQIKKHEKIWADGYNGIDLDETPEDIEKMLIKKRKERLERIRKKKEGKK